MSILPRPLPLPDLPKFKENISIKKWVCKLIGLRYLLSSRRVRLRNISPQKKKKKKKIVLPKCTHLTCVPALSERVANSTDRPLKPCFSWPHVSLPPHAQVDIGVESLLISLVVWNQYIQRLNYMSNHQRFNLYSFDNLEVKILKGELWWKFGFLQIVLEQQPTRTF